MVKVWKETKKALTEMKEGQIVMQVKGGKLYDPNKDFLAFGASRDWTDGGKDLKKRKV